MLGEVARLTFGATFRRRKGVLCPCRGDQARYPDQGDGPSDVVGERGETELAANVLQPAHEERTMAHPLFDGAERVLDTVSPFVEHARLEPPHGV